MLPENERRMKAVLAEVKDIADGRTQLSGPRLKARLDSLIAESDQIEAADIRTKQHRARFTAGLPGDTDTTPRTKAVSGPRWRPPSPADISEEQIESAWLAAKSNIPYQFELGPQAAPSWNMAGGVHTKAMRDDIRTKQTTEGLPGTLLPPALLPERTLRLPYEPDRIFEHFMGAVADSQTIQYLQHTSNTNPAAPVAELGTKPDLGQVWTPKTVSFQKIAALCSASMELLDDFAVFSQFMINDLTRAIIDAETDYIVNHAVTGLIWQAEYGLPNPALSRTLGADTPLDCLEKACDDIRVGSAYGTADKMAMHPNTLGYIKRQKSTLNTYILTPNPQTGVVDKIWTCDVITNSKIPMGYVLVWDSSQAILAWTRQALTVQTNPYATTAWTNNFIYFRGEERIQVGIPRPTALNIVTGLPGAGS